MCVLVVFGRYTLDYILNGSLHNIANYFLNEKGSLFEYFWKGFNVSLISIGEHNSLFNTSSGLIHLAVEKLFDYLSFYEASAYIASISAFTISKHQKQSESFKDLLLHYADQPAKSDVANIEVRTKMEAFEVLRVLNSVAVKGNFFVRVMLYNTKSQTVSNLHLVCSVAHPNLRLQTVVLDVIG
eukprot:TRINITY_DN11125_c0_g1_i2.p1 TRINITY_DN11125_c0_g1~~TRINITY_DN11125_c0_g1_i2.p1  ORF type:complete len:184 (-),score=15.52 TRINITY_DN11125_c0_g1_i2:359-910(-)